jgi:hypothetical protein
MDDPLKRRLAVAIPLLLGVVLVAWWVRPRNKLVGEGYISERNVTLYSSLAQVREPLATLHYGDRVEILLRKGEQLKVRSNAGTVGWLDARFLMEPALWQRSAQLLAQARNMPVQARGRTKVSSNVRVDPGRNAPRLYQFGRGVGLDILGRSVGEMTPTSEEPFIASKDSTPPETKKEDWFLVRGVAANGLASKSEAPGKTHEPVSAGGESDEAVPIAGWIIARFVELDLPEPVRESAAAAGLRVMAWFELNRVPDPPGEKPQFLVAGTHGGEGQPCDFTQIRVYTWGRKRSRYETAFVEGNLCGKLPIRVAKASSGEPEFRFFEIASARQERVYQLKQTVVRRVRQREEKTKPQPRKRSR